MEDIETACKQVLDHVAGSFACGIVDIEEKQMREVHQPFHFPPEQKALVAHAVSTLFSSPYPSILAQTVREQLDISSTGPSEGKEIQISLKEALYFGKSIKNGKAAVLLVTNHEVDIVTAWTQLKSIIPTIEALIS
ncbi:MAG: hypothetical protein ACE5GK_08145 [Nitrospiria bacterium]